MLLLCMLIFSLVNLCRPYSDRLLTGCQLLAALGFFSVGGGVFGALAFVILLWTTCGTVNVCGLRFTVFLALLAAAEAGVLTYGIERFDQAWDLLTSYVFEEEDLDAEVVDTIKESFVTYSWAAYVTLFSSVCWLFCAMNLLFFIQNYKKALVVLPQLANKEQKPVKEVAAPMHVIQQPTYARDYDSYLYDMHEASA